DDQGQFAVARRCHWNIVIILCTAKVSVTSVVPGVAFGPGPMPVLMNNRASCKYWSHDTVEGIAKVANLPIGIRKPRTPTPQCSCPIRVQVALVACARDVGTPPVSIFSGSKCPTQTLSLNAVTLAVGAMACAS